MRPREALAGMKLLDWLRQPEAREITDLDDQATVAVHARIIRTKGFLRRLYTDLYSRMGTAGGWNEHGVFVEIGSGGGFITEVLPGTITSDLVAQEGVDRVFPAEAMPFADESVDGVFFLNCFHHCNKPALVLAELERVLAPGGSVVMIEPANTVWSRLVYTRLHHEPFDPSGQWSLPRSGRLSGANGALPWIVFVRDAGEYRVRFPRLVIESLCHHTPFSYLISGGLSWRQLVPSWSYPLFISLERLLQPLSPWLGMFMTVVLRKRSTRDAQ